MILEVRYKGEVIDNHDVEVQWKDIYGTVHKGSILSYGKSCAWDEADMLDDMF